MSTDPILQRIFESEVLRSERQRVIGVLTLLAVLVLIVIVRAMLAGNAAQLNMVPLLIGIAVGAAAYEYWMLRKITSALQNKSRIGIRIWILNVIVEASLPTVGLIVLTESTFIGPYRALVAPAILVYPMFVILSTLQMRPGLSVLSGSVAAISYSLVAISTFLRYEPEQFSAIVLPVQLYATYAIFLFALGAIAAFVSSRMRRYVKAGLQEGIRRQRMEGDMELARSIQRGLLPDEPPIVEGFDIAGWNEPADQTGGDYYDWMEMPDGNIAVTIADATGHGIGPALLAAVCRAYARACISEHDTLTSVLQRMNDLLHTDIPGDRFVTFALVALNPRDRTVRFLSAGHGPLLYYTAATGEVESLSADAIPLGIVSGIEFDPLHQREMKPGDALVLVTDGFFEWSRADGTQYGTERLIEFIRQNAALSARELIDGLHESVRSFVGDSPQSDDLTAVVVKGAG